MATLHVKCGSLITIPPRSQVRSGTNRTSQEAMHGERERKSERYENNQNDSVRSRQGDRADRERKSEIPEKKSTLFAPPSNLRRTHPRWLRWVEGEVNPHHSLLGCSFECHYDPSVPYRAFPFRLRLMNLHLVEGMRWRRCSKKK